MIIEYEFANGEKTEVEVDASIGAVIIDSRRKEASGDRKYRRHNWSLDAITYEGIEFGTEDFTKTMFSDEEDQRQKVRDAFSYLTPTQQRRMKMLADGLSIREIARREDKDFKTIHESIEAARKKFMKHFK